MSAMTPAERADLAATLETRTAEHALAMERVRELEARLAAARKATDDLPRHLGATWRGQQLRAALVEPAAETWQSAPDAPGLWWRDGGDGPVAWEVRVSPQRRGALFAQEAVGEECDTSLDLSPRSGVRWARCLPPEILAPGEPTRADLAAQLAAVTAERDALAALRPRDPHRTGHRCACCGREGAPTAEVSRG